MPRDLFGNVTDPSIKLGSRKWYTVPLSLAVHTLVVLVLVVVPLLATGALPLPSTSVVFVPAVSTPVPPAPPVRRLESVSKPAVNTNAAPLDTPSTIQKETGLEAGFEQGVDGGTGVEALGVIEGIGTLPEPPTPPPAAPEKPVRPGGDIKPPTKIRDVAPVYPTLALLSRVQGMVIIEATIDVEGRVQDARVLRSDSPLLNQAALTAVREWAYTPTTLNGRKVSVVMTVTVHFRLR